MIQHFSLMVPGALASSKSEVHAPFDGTLIATTELAGSDAVDRALATAHGLFRNRDAWLPPARRIAILRKTAILMEARAEELALEAAREGGKPLVDSRVEVARAIDGISNCAELLRNESGHVIPMNINVASAGRVAFTRHEPIGVVVALSAFNHPVNLIVHQIFPALAAGCPFIVKPAMDTPLSCMRVLSILRQAGLPEEWGQALLTESNDIAGQLATDRRVGFLSFIGSARVGWSLRSKLAPGARCALEHGGVAPVIVSADANLDHAVSKIAKGGFYHAGQVCVSVQRVYVQRAIAEPFTERLTETARRLKVGDPTLAETEVGPLIRHAEVERIDAWIKEAAQGGAEIRCGGKAISASCYEPTVLFEPADDERISREEVFGPVVCVYKYDELDQAIERANALPVAFQAAVFTNDYKTAMHAYARLDASAVMINDHTAFRVDWMPFAGLRESGLGVGGIPYTFREMQIEKMFVGPLD
ncbi:MAG: aldehyde dehydrogenase family protein [Vicinamibacterales bacterium]